MYIDDGSAKPDHLIEPVPGNSGGCYTSVASTKLRICLNGTRVYSWQLLI